jgi:GNAT superfamily N-acetyltransferase
MSDPITIRDATPADVARLVKRYEWLFEPPGSRPPTWDPSRAQDRLTAMCGTADEVILLAVTEVGDIVGFCAVHLDITSVRFGRRAWVEDLAVDSAHRSAGVGKRLLDEAKRWARTHGATHLELDSATARADAHRFYRREQPSWESVCFGWQLI